MIKLIITDIGGVLIKTDEAIISCIERVFKNNKIPLGSREKMLDVFGTSVYDYIKNYLPEGYENRVDKCYNDFKKIYPKEVIDLMQVFEGVNRTLQFLEQREIKLAVLSCMIKKEVKVNLSLLDFKKFDLIFSLEDYGYKRPSPNGLRMIMERLNAKPEETMYVGDTLNDIRMARNAGVVSVGVRTGVQNKKNLEKENPDYLIASFKEIREII